MKNDREYQVGPKGNFNFNLDVRQVSLRSCRNLIDFTTLITRIEWKNSFRAYSTLPFSKCEQSDHGFLN